MFEEEILKLDIHMGRIKERLNGRKEGRNVRNKLWKKGKIKREKERSKKQRD
jgi:hypothetical protein